ncbi:MAG: hypothetical protein K5925_01555 [Bacilli bacterium]|nr:hypothetical protein [Bacilli bacterium]
MKTASKVMYIIGMITNVLLFIAATLMLVVFIIGKVNPDVANQIAERLKQTVPYVDQLLGAGIGVTIFLLVANLIVLIIAISAIKNLNRGTGRVGTHVILMIGGIISWDIFYFLGGLFGIIGGSRD